MFYTDESVNQLFDYSKKMVDTAVAKRVPCPELKPFQYLIFAGMISYYGFESVQDIYKSFEKTNFYYTTGSLKEKIKKTQLCSNTELVNFDENKNHYVPAVTIRNIYQDSFGRFHIERNIFVSQNSNTSNLEALECTVHEINHVINSLNSPICIRKTMLFARLGVGIRNIVTSERENIILEEAFNVLQTKEILDEILTFTQFNIKNKDIANLLNSIQFAYGKNISSTAYCQVVPFVKPLYEDDKFYTLNRTKRLDGNIKDIRTNFDQKTEENGFVHLGHYLEKIWNYPYHDEFSVQKVKSLVTNYTSH